ncbi:MAG TPA: hypothetical protein VMV49_17635 [Candidatus Deferrimicrobium sp.]|nr:hypothetical protein [Candidatus Deferrimicrobium sp.]
MATKTICFGFDGICVDMSFIIRDLLKHRNELRIKYPFLDPIFNLLLSEKPEDCELQFESTKFGFETFFDCIFTLNELTSQKTTRVGANSAIETVTAINLLKDPIYPIDYTKIYFLGNYSTEISQKLPKEQRIPSIFLEHANFVKTSYIPISIIIPYGERRGIISFGGIPNIRRIESLNPYMKNIISIVNKLNPDLMAILGTTNVYATTENFEDFKLLDPFLNLRYSLVDLGGTVGWSYQRLKEFYQVLEKAKIIIGNDEEFKSWYNFKFGKSIQDSDPTTIYKIVNALRKKDQIAICHTQYYQFVVGMEEKKETIRDCMKFANKATVVKTNINAFPTAKQIEEAQLKEKSFQLPEILEANAIVARSIDQEITNPVGLGDVWSCTFCIGLLSQNIL